MDLPEVIVKGVTILFMIALLVGMVLCLFRKPDDPEIEDEPEPPPTTGERRHG
jgi:hypothetical protein